MGFATATSIACGSPAFAELSTDLLKSGRSVRFRARGTSMSPLVRDGDVVLVQPVEAGSIRVGDLVFFSQEPGNIVVHRVIRKQAGPEGVQFTVQGDQVSRPDGVIPMSQVYGKVVAVDRQGVRIETDRPVMRILGWSMVLRSRWRFGRGRPYRLARLLLKKLP
jgi:signal peptidase I